MVPTTKPPQKKRDGAARTVSTGAGVPVNAIHHADSPGNLALDNLRVTIVVATPLPDGSGWRQFHRRPRDADPPSRK
jgi:hypothetical protein